MRVQTAGDRRIFADEIGFIDPVKADKLERSFELPGQAAHDTKRLEIARIEPLGAMEVFDIQTESGEYLSGNLRVHNCFILAVDDTMDSILDWYKEEGLIFKGGSGAGVNLSRIRSSQGAALLRRHGQRAGLLHARRGRVGRHHQVRRGHPPGREDGRPRRRSPRRRGVHRDQGARGREGPGPARRRVRHGPGRQGHRQRPVPERQQLGPGLRRVHARGRAGRQVRPGGPADRGDRRDGGRPGPVPQDGPGGLGLRRSRASSTTAPSTTGTPARNRAGSPPATRAASTSTWTTHRATWPASTC